MRDRRSNAAAMIAALLLSSSLEQSVATSQPRRRHVYRPGDSARPKKAKRTPYSPAKPWSKRMAGRGARGGVPR